MAAVVELLMEEEEEVEDVQYKRLYVDYLFVSVIVLIIIARIFDFNGNGGIINGVGGGEEVQYKLICRLFVFVSVIVSSP